MKYLTILVLFGLCNLSTAQVTITTDFGQDIKLTAMQSLSQSDADWQKALKVIVPEDYETYCSFYLTECPIERATFDDYLQQLSRVEITPLAKTNLQLDGNDYLLFSMEMKSEIAPALLVPLLVLQSGGDFRLIPQEQEQKLFSTKALITYMDHNQFLENAVDVFGNVEKIPEVTIYERLVEEASVSDISQSRLFRLPPLQESKSLPVTYQGRISAAFSKQDFDKAQILFQRGFEVEAANILTSKITPEELQKIIKDEAKN